LSKGTLARAVIGKEQYREIRATHPHVEIDMAKKKQSAKAQQVNPPAEPVNAPTQPEHTVDAATPHTAAGVSRGAIPVPVAKRGGFIPPGSRMKGGGRGGGPAPTGKGGGMNMRATSHTKGARGR